MPANFFLARLKNLLLCQGVHCSSVSLAEGFLTKRFLDFPVQSIFFSLFPLAFPLCVPFSRFSPAFLGRKPGEHAEYNEEYLFLEKIMR